MAGHSQFKNIMHRKGRQDAARAKLFAKLAREITVSVRNGLPDPEMNARLQSEAIKLGAVTYLNADEAAASAKTNDALVTRPWELWKRKVMKPE